MRRPSFSFSLLQSGKEESLISFHPEGGLHACAPILHVYFAWNQGNCVYLLFSLLSVYTKGKNQPFHHHSSLSRHAQVRHNRCQKDVPAQVWQATANTNVMFFKLYINKSWQNYSEQIPTTVFARKITSCYKLHKSQRTFSFFSLQIPLTLCKICTHKSDDPFHTPEMLTSQLMLPSVPENWNNSKAMLNKMSVRWENNNLWSYYRYQPVFTLHRPVETSFTFNLIWRNCCFEENRWETFAQKWWPDDCQSPQGALSGGAGGYRTEAHCTFSGPLHGSQCKV